MYAVDVSLLCDEAGRADVAASAVLLVGGDSPVSFLLHLVEITAQERLSKMCCST